nr:hypothetical protein [Deltaproteobacteria bacterium]
MAASEGAAASVQTSSAAAPKGDGGDDPPDSAPLEGTGEGPPPGTRLEGLLVSLVALAIIIIPVMACLDRVRGALASATHLTFVAGPLAKVLAFLLPRDMSWGSVYVQNGTLWIGFLGAL